MEFTERELELISYGLYTMECHLYSGDLDNDIASDIGEDTQPEEVRAVMDRIKAEK